jgi:hypothetical protein
MVQGCFRRNSMVTSIKQGQSNRTENIRLNIWAKDEGQTERTIEKGVQKMNETVQFTKSPILM